MTMLHCITGYGKRTDLLAFEHPIQQGRLADVRALANVPAEDVTAAGSYPLTVAIDHQIGASIDRSLDVDAYDWFLEPFSDG